MQVFVVNAYNSAHVRRFMEADARESLRLFPVSFESQQLTIQFMWAKCVHLRKTMGETARLTAAHTQLNPYTFNLFLPCRTHRSRLLIPTPPFTTTSS